MMRTDEVKIRIIRFVNDIIDKYFPQTNIIEKVKNSTAKFWVEQNTNRLDGILKIFADADDCIDVNKLVLYYENALFENGEDLRIDIRGLLPENMYMIKSILPDKLIIIRKSDLYDLFHITPPSITPYNI